MDGLILGLLFAIAVPFVLPIASWVSARRTRARVAELRAAVEAQSAALDLLKVQVAQLRRQVREAPADATAEAPAAPPARPPAPAPAPAPAAAPIARPAPAAPPAAPAAPPPAPLGIPPSPTVTAPAQPAAPRENPWPERQPAAAAASAPAAATVGAPGVPGPPSPPRPPRTPPPPPSPRFDWESLVGVKLFSAIAGVALVFAAVFFLRYSVEHGWLQPPVRVLIGVAVAVALLVVCELKAARRYPATANALDAAAIAILFATFFAAHALWNLIPATVTFGLLAVVTAIAVLLSIRRESLFIAVLGLLGGFATPALLSTGENRPVPLFAYLMLLNVGLAWVAYRQTWPALTALTLVFTTIYQWGWVFTYLAQSELTLAMGIFVIFPLATFVGLALARRRPPGTEASAADVAFERTAVIGAALPLLFAVYLSVVPAYGARPGLLFGFLLLVDAGLFAVAMARRQWLLHAAGAVATLAVMPVWLTVSYAHTAAYPALMFCAAFSVFYAIAPAIAGRLGRPLGELAQDAVFASPLLLVVLTGLARIEPIFAAPWPLFGTLLGLVLLIAWRAIATPRGGLYYVAAFFAVATQAAWSTAHLTIDRLGTAVAIYAVFGVVSMAIPLVARRAGRALQPEGGGGVVLIASLGLLLFLSSGPIAPATLWALALLLAILNAGLFVESASGGLPLVSVAGSLVSWIILANWWLRAGASVGVLPSLAVLTGLTLVTLGGHAWTQRRWLQRAAGRPGAAPFVEGPYLGLIGHLFLLFVAVNREWSLPPWPWFATLGVMTLGVSTVSLATRTPALHAAGAVAAAVIMSAWTYATGAPAWMPIALIASGIVSLYALGWMLVARRAGGLPEAAVAAGATLFVREGTVMLAVAAGGAPFPMIVAAQVANFAILLALTWARRWRHVALWAVAVASVAVVVQWQSVELTVEWQHLLVLAFALYAVFTAYPLILGSRTRGERDPHVAAVLASVMFFLAARAALNAGGYRWMVGMLPVAEGAVMAVLLRQLLRIEPKGTRDLGRLALVAGAALAFVTVAIPLQLSNQWITIGWALEGAALAWLYTRIPHKGLLGWSAALLAAVFVRLAMNPEVLRYEPRGSMRILNWYLYAYLICAAAFLLAAWWLSRTDDRLPVVELRPSGVLPACAVILLFLLLNIEIADFYATGPAIMFRFGVTVSQDLTYTIGWLLFGMALLAVCIYLHTRAGRIAALALIAITTCKAFLYDLGSLGGLYRVASFVGLAMALALVSIALQKYVLTKPDEAR